MSTPGTLYLVATPIGNFDDMTLRALAILRSADLVVCEEFKEGRRLLAHYGIADKRIETLNEHNEAAAGLQIIEHLLGGKNVALISDAGTPVFSDPGRELVGNAVARGVAVVPVPGASSLMPALAVSGFAIEQFLFYGFPSPKSHKRIAELRQLRNEKRAMILMDAPYRLVPLLRDLAEVFANARRVCIAFNLTMPDEQIFRGTALELFRALEKKGMKGEFVVVIEGTGGKHSAAAVPR